MRTIKLIKKIIWTSIGIICLICILNKNYSNADLSSDIAEIIDYKTVSQDGEPEKYDIMINASDLDEDAEIPVIQASTDYVLNGNWFLNNIDFFNINKDSNTSKFSIKYWDENFEKNLKNTWEKIKEITISSTKISLYFAVAAILTYLIYIGFLIVKDTIFGENVSTPMESKLSKNYLAQFGKSITQDYKEKKFVEQGIIAIFLIAFIVILITLVISFSNYLSSVIPDLKDGGLDSIIVYLKADRISNTNVQQTGGNNNSSNILFIGDSRTEYIRTHVQSNAKFICKTSMGYNWMVDEAFPEADSQVTRGTKVIIWLGVNDIENQNNYIPAVNAKAEEWVAKGAEVFYAEIGPLKWDDRYATNAKIQKFNQDLKNGLSSNVTVIPLYDKLESEGFEMVGPNDSTHYNKETDIRIHDYLVNAVNSGVSSSSNSRSGQNSSTASPFTKYNLTEDQITRLAAVAFSEQGWGDLEGGAAEASIMANIYELHHKNEYKDVYDYVSKGPWFYKAHEITAVGKKTDYRSAWAPVTEEEKAVVRSVLVYGKRTIPGYIDEHDSWSEKDYTATQKGVDVTYSRESYIPFETYIENTHGSEYTFWGWANPNESGSDPFGYTSEDIRARMGEFHYDFNSGMAVGGTSSMFTESCYFKTNLEGLYILESSYNWDMYTGHNIQYMICGVILTAFKFLLYGVLVLRTFIVAFLIVIAPIVVIINAFMKATGDKGIIETWLRWFIYLALLKPALQIIYHVMAEINTSLVTENPFYILLVIVVMIIFTKITFDKIVRNKKKVEE